MDIAFLLLLFLFAYLDARKGFIACFFSFISTITAVLVAMLFASGFQSLTGGLFGLQGLIGTGLSNAFSSVAGLNIDISASGVESQLSTVALPQFLKDKVIETIQGATGDLAAGTTLAMQIGDVVSQFIVLLISAIVLFILVKLVMRLLKSLLTRFAESWTAIRKVNRLLGMGVGLLKVFGIVCVLFAILALFPNEGITTFMSESLLLSGLYNNNPIHAVFGLFVS